MSEKYYVFGAHPRGWTFYEYMKMLKPQCRMLGFLFDNDVYNQAEVTIKDIDTNCLPTRLIGEVRRNC